MFCKSCGKEVKDEAVICPYCGCALAKIEVNGETEKPEGKRKINVSCLVGFILSALSWILALFGTVAIVGLILSIVGLVQANRKNERLKGLGIAGIPVAACSLIYTLCVLIGIQFSAALLY